MPEAAGVKCVVWDLDNTLWRGVLLEWEGRVSLRDEVPRVLRTLDERGIVHAVASRGEPEVAAAELGRLGLADWFVRTRVGWGAKAASIAEIASDLNIGLDTVLFVDDDAFEREAVRHQLPEVRTADPGALEQLLTRPDCNPPVISADARLRRARYRADARRREAEAAFDGSEAAFLRSLALVLTVRAATVDDLVRAEELTLRTNQMNSTGATYSRERLEGLAGDGRHRLLVVELEDRFGSYGAIGLALLGTGRRSWMIKLLLTSCRVVSRGVGGLLLHHLIARAQERGASLDAGFVATGRNRLMEVTYRLAGFTPVARRRGVVLLRHRGPAPPVPEHVDLRADW